MLGNVEIDWVAERSFAAIPALHPGVRRVIACEIRRWRRSWWSRATRSEWRQFKQSLRECGYDAIVDTQGLLKSAILARVACGVRYGMDWRSSREPLRPFYDRVFEIPRSLHAVERNRMLCALALGYDVPATLHYGLQPVHEPSCWLPDGSFVVFLHATSHPRKLWPEERWVELGCRYAQSGVFVVLPWGSAAELERAQRLAAQLPGAVVPDRLDLRSAAGLLAGAAAVVGVDTGLTHLAAALDRPVVGIYGATSPERTGVYSSGQATSIGSNAGFPTVDEVCAALGGMGVAPTDIAPRRSP
jgi:heptosyltransferase-1